MVKLAMKTDESALDAVVTARWRAPTQEPCGTRVTGVRPGGLRECWVHQVGASITTVLDCWS